MAELYKIFLGEEQLKIQSIDTSGEGEEHQQYRECVPIQIITEDIENVPPEEAIEERNVSEYDVLYRDHRVYLMKGEDLRVLH